LLAAADCTGHGVPGAFMSLIGMEKLTEAAAQADTPPEILAHLNKGIKSSLNQTGADESTRDGMDIALCAVNVKEKIVTYSGANRPLWVIRKGANEVEEIKATKTAIGGLTRTGQVFERNDVSLAEGDTFYILSDGYADQFSGVTGKKLMTKKLKDILLSIQDKSMAEQQKHLDNFLETWKAGSEQLDDVLVIGLRV
jgi:serine phosphatase RsbU (regulator of sigma subunit)